VHGFLSLLSWRIVSGVGANAGTMREPVRENGAEE